MIDDSALFHGRYDPTKAHDYYMRTRHLKGRVAALEQPGRPTRSGTKAPGGSSGGKPNRADTKSYHAKLEAEKAALEKRLTHLRDVLKQLVDAAKKRSGGDPNHHKSTTSTPASKTPASTKAGKSGSTKSKPLTAAQKQKKAHAAKVAYEKAHPNSLSQDIHILQAQVEDIHAKIKQALADAQQRRNKAGSDGSNRPAHDKTTSGPRGR